MQKWSILILVITVIAGSIFFIQKNDVIKQTSPDDFLAREKTSLINANPESKTEIKEANSLPELDCQNQSGSTGIFACYEKFYQELVAGSDPKAAMVDLKTRYHYEPYVKNECHQLAHIIGRAATAKYPTVDEAYIRGDSACWSGYYHGVIESVMLAIGSSNINFETLDGICRNLADRERYSFNHYNCVHGIGHGAMYINGNELFVALDTCDKLQDHWEKSSCWGGAFMENIIADNKNHFTRYLKSDDPLYPCNAVRDNQKSTCYLMQTSYMLKLKGGDFTSVFTLCGTVGEAYVEICYQSLGRDASGWTISDPVRTKSYCLLGSDERAQSNCIIGAVKDFISYHHSDVQATAFCNSLEKGLKNICLSTSEAYYRTFN